MSSMGRVLIAAARALDDLFAYTWRCGGLGVFQGFLRGCLAV
jgi:hypothetical protein